MSEKFFRLKKAGENESGYASYERVDGEDWVGDFLSSMKNTVQHIAVQAEESVSGIADAIENRSLTFEQRKALSDVLLNIAPLAMAVMLPQQSSEDPPVSPTEELVSVDVSVHEKSEIPVPSREGIDTERGNQEDKNEFQKEFEKRLAWWQSDMKDYFETALTLADERVVGAEQLTREEYIRTQTKFEPHKTWGELPEATQGELLRLLPALAVQESGYHNGLVSNAGAVGILQQLPGTIEQLSPYEADEVQRSLAKQTEVAGAYFINARYVMFDSERYGVGELVKKELARRHGAEEFEKEFLPRLLVNAYNVGPAGMAGVVREYFEVEEHRDSELHGEALFFDIIEWAHKQDKGAAASFGDDARNYVIKIYAAATLLEQRKEEND